jgi:hypothetical protein
MEKSLSAEVREAMVEALAAGGFPSIEAAAWEVSLTVALSKVSAYERECEQFRRQYSVSLEAFRTHMEEMTNREDFAMENDLADWEFAERALQLWQKRVEILRHAAA